jgi:hypothetical protein
MMRITERSLRSRLSRSSSKLQMWKRSCSAPSSLTRESQKLRGNGSVLEQPFSLCQLLGSQGLKWFPNQNFVESWIRCAAEGKRNKLPRKFILTRFVCVLVVTA